MDNFFSQYQHPKWQHRRLEYINDQVEFLKKNNEDGPRCEWCLDTEHQLQLHHIIYHKDRKIWDYDDEDLLLLCSECHKKFHGYHNNIKAMIKEIISCPDNIGSLEELLYSLLGKNPLEIMHAAKAVQDRMRLLDDERKKGK